MLFGGPVGGEQALPPPSPQQPVQPRRRRRSVPVTIRRTRTGSRTIGVRRTNSSAASNAHIAATTTAPPVPNAANSSSSHSGGLPAPLSFGERQQGNGGVGDVLELSASVSVRTPLKSSPIRHRSGYSYAASSAIPGNHHHHHHSNPNADNSNHNSNGGGGASCSMSMSSSAGGDASGTAAAHDRPTEEDHPLSVSGGKHDASNSNSGGAGGAAGAAAHWALYPPGLRPSSPSPSTAPLPHSSTSDTHSGRGASSAAPLPFQSVAPTGSGSQRSATTTPAAQGSSNTNHHGTNTGANGSATQYPQTAGAAVNAAAGGGVFTSSSSSSRRHSSQHGHRDPLRQSRSGLVSSAMIGGGGGGEGSNAVGSPHTGAGGSSGAGSSSNVGEIDGWLRLKIFFESERIARTRMVKRDLTYAQFEREVAQRCDLVLPDTPHQGPLLSLFYRDKEEDYVAIDSDELTRLEREHRNGFLSVFVRRISTDIALSAPLVSRVASGGGGGGGPMGSASSPTSGSARDRYYQQQQQQQQQQQAQSGSHFPFQTQTSLRSGHRRSESGVLNVAGSSSSLFTIPAPPHLLATPVPDGTVGGGGGGGGGGSSRFLSTPDNQSTSSRRSSAERVRGGGGIGGFGGGAGSLASSVSHQQPPPSPSRHSAHRYTGIGGSGSGDNPIGMSRAAAAAALRGTTGSAGPLPPPSSCDYAGEDSTSDVVNGLVTPAAGSGSLNSSAASGSHPLPRGADGGGHSGSARTIPYALGGTDRGGGGGSSRQRQQQQARGAGSGMVEGNDPSGSTDVGNIPVDDASTMELLRGARRGSTNDVRSPPAAGGGGTGKAGRYAEGRNRPAPPTAGTRYASSSTISSVSEPTVARLRRNNEQHQQGHQEGGPSQLQQQQQPPPSSTDRGGRSASQERLEQVLRVTERGRLLWTRAGVIGKGAFGTVFEGVLEDGRHVAVKVLDVPQLTTSAMEEQTPSGPGLTVKKLIREVNLMRNLRHPNIVAYIHCQVARLMDDRLGGMSCDAAPAATGWYNPSSRSQPLQVEILMELCTNGSLSLLVRKQPNRMLPVVQARAYTRQILQGLVYLHAHGYIHRDIKTDNVLIGADGVAKLADFGCSRRIRAVTSSADAGGDTMSNASFAGHDVDGSVLNRLDSQVMGTMGGVAHTVVGTPLFMAPEIAAENGEGYTDKADIWSVGCLVLNLFGRIAWPARPGEGYFQLVTRICKADKNGFPPGFPKDAPRALRAFLESCLCHDQRKRGSARELLKMEWMTCPDSELEEVPPPSRRNGEGR